MRIKLSTLQVCAIAYFIILSNNLGITVYNMFHYTRQDSLITIFIGTVLGFIPLLVYLKIMNYKPSLNFFEKVNSCLPSCISFIVNLVITLVILYTTTLFFYNMTNFISSQYLPKTPSMIVYIFFLLPIVYLLNKGLTVIGRTTFVLLLISITLLFLSVIGLIWQINIDNLFPILENGFGGPIKNSLIYICYNIVPLIMLSVIPLDNIVDKDKFNKRMIITYIVSNIVIFIFFFLILTILGSNLANLYQFPEYDLLKKVSLFGFIERTESTVSLRWIFYIFIMVVMGIYFICEYLKYTFKIKNKKINKIIGFLISLVVVVASNYLFKNNTVANIFIYNKLSFVIWFVLFGIPFLISFNIKKKL